MAREWNSTSSTTGLLPRVLGSKPAIPSLRHVDFLYVSRFSNEQRHRTAQEAGAPCAETPQADFSVIGVQLSSTITAIFACVTLSGQ